MKRALRALYALLALALLLPVGAARADGEELPDVSAGGAILIEASTGRVLLAQNADAPLPMASTTKVMTALLAAEHGDLDALVPVPDSAYGTEGSSMYLHRGERVSLRDLLYGLMLRSGNDAALTIANHIGGSTEDFAARMNARAKEIGCQNTHFVNPNGLPAEGHYTTARDLAQIAAVAMQNETFRLVVGTSYYEAKTGDQLRVLQNKNRLLWQYEGGCGVKTGFTKAAGRCLVFSAEREGMLLVGVLLNCPDMWNTAYAMLDYGFAAYEMRRLLSAGTPIGTVSVSRGESEVLELYAKEDILYPIKRDGSDAVEWKLARAESLNAPVVAGHEAGIVTLYVNGSEASGTPLIVTRGAARADVGYYLGEILSIWSA